MRVRCFDAILIDFRRPESLEIPREKVDDVCEILWHCLLCYHWHLNVVVIWLLDFTVFTWNCYQILCGLDFRSACRVLIIFYQLTLDFKFRVLKSWRGINNDFIGLLIAKIWDASQGVLRCENIQLNYEWWLRLLGNVETSQLRILNSLIKEHIFDLYLINEGLNNLQQHHWSW